LNIHYAIKYHAFCQPVSILKRKTKLQKGKNKM